MTALGTAAIVGAREKTPALRIVITVLLVLMVAANALYLIGLIVSGGVNTPFINVGVSQATQWIPAAIFWLVASQPGPARLPVTFAAIGVTTTALGDTYYSSAMDGDGYLAFPSLADPAYLLFYPLMIAALVLLVRRPLAGVGRLVLLETAVATVGASALLAALLGPVIDSALTSSTALESAVALAYPLFDLILIAVIAGIASVPTVRIGRRWWALIAGLGTWVAGDVTYALLAETDDYLAGTPLDATWAVGLAFITWWVVGISRPRAEASTTSRRNAVSLPAIAVLTGLAVLVLGTQMHLSELAVVLAALTVGLGLVPIVFRQAVLGRMLAAQEEAVRRLTELDQAKTDMLVTVNHEFRTPLTSISGHVELLLDGGAGELPPDAISMLRTIERNGERLQGLIDDTFTASRLENLETPVVRSPLGVADVVTQAVASVEPLATSRGITIALEGDIPELTIDADGARLVPAIANLVDNAVKFTSPGGQVKVAVESSPTDGDVVIRVADSGIGIPSDDIPRLFSRFFRASNVQGAAIPGVGLGLAISRQVVQTHGGTIAVESALGNGTTVTVRLPVSVAVADD